MPLAELEAGRAARITVRDAVSDPDEALVVDEEAVREVHDPLAEALHEPAIHVDLDDRIEIRLGAAVGAAAVEDPEVLAVTIGTDAARDPDLAAFELVPVVVDLVGIVGDLRDHIDASPIQQDRQATEHTHRNANRMPHCHLIRAARLYTSTAATATGAHSDRHHAESSSRQVAGAGRVTRSHDRVGDQRVALDDAAALRHPGIERNRPAVHLHD
jgi:hypothetical protein